MMTKRLWPALALFVLPSIGCVGGPPVDESVPVAAAVAPATTVRNEAASGSVGAAEAKGASGNMLCIPKVQQVPTDDDPSGTGPVTDGYGPDGPGDCGPGGIRQ